MRFSCVNDRFCYTFCMTTDTPSLEQALSRMGQDLARARVLKNLTQDELAQVCGVSRRAIQHLEAGKNVAVALWMAAAMRLGYLTDLLDVMEQNKPATMEQFQGLANGRHVRRQRARK